MKHPKKWLSLLLAVVMVFSTVTPCLAAAAPDPLPPAAGEPAGSRPPEVTLAEDGKNILVNGTFCYPSIGAQDYAAPFFYEDTYFTRSAYEYQDSLATMTLCLALSAFGSPRAKDDYTQKSMNLAQLLQDCGFPEEHFATNDAFLEKPTTDSIAVGVSYKTVWQDGQPRTLVAAAIRGGAYESEWASNFTMGREGQHLGFAQARDQILDYLRTYLAQEGITGDIKLWITGYSRAAATANLVAGALDGGASLGDDVRLAGEDLFAYCYECPQGAALTDDVDAPVYGNIFNIVNPGDLVTKIGPSRPTSFGFQRFGVNHYLPTALKEGERYSALHSAMLEQYHALPSTGEYIVDDFQMKRISLAKLIWDPSGALKDGIVVDNHNERWDMNAFLDEFIYRFFSQSIRSRDNYVDNYEPGIREMCHLMFGCTGRWEELADHFLANLQSQSRKIFTCLALQMYPALNTLVQNALQDALHQAGITDYTPRQLASFTGDVVRLLLLFGASNPNLTVTALENLPIIGGAHFPEVCMAWLRSFDPHYAPSAEAAFNSGIHRVVHIGGEADVRVYDSTGAVAASIVDNVSQEDDGSSIVSYLSQADEKLVYLPADESYRVEVEPTADGTMTYAVQEYSEDAGGVSRIVNYYDLDARRGDAWTGTVPGISEAAQHQALLDGTAAAYTLRAPDGRSMSSDEDLAGREAAAADCSVQVTTKGQALGFVTGSTMVKTGGWAKLQAIPNLNCRFVGWYRNGELISDDPEYTFCVKEDMDLEGRFALGRRGDPQPEPETPVPVPSAPEEWDASFRWSEDRTACEAVLTAPDGRQETLPCTVTQETVPAGPGRDGRIVYTASVTFDGRDYTDTQSVVLPAPEEPAPAKRPVLQQVRQWVGGLLQRWFG